MQEILSSLGYLLALALLFAVVAFIGFIGINCRRAYEYGRRGDARSRKPLCIGLGGLLFLIAIGFGVARTESQPLAVLVYGAIVLALLVFGWFGKLVVPESLGD